MKKHKNCLLGLNPGSIQIQREKHVLYQLIKQTSVLFVNLEEARHLTHESKLEIHHLITRLWKLGAKQVVITDSINGSHGFDGKDLYHCKSFPAKLKEATGAGDAFATGFMGATLSGLPMSEALAWGAVNAASSVEHVGPQKGLLTDTQIKSRLKKKPSFKSKLI